MLSGLTFDDGNWSVSFTPRIISVLGNYDIRIILTDSDGKTSGSLEFSDVVTVINNQPTPPEIYIQPDEPMTDSQLRVMISRSATDVESSMLTYSYQWYRDGEAMEGMTNEVVPSDQTSRGENWSVEARAFDGTDHGVPGLAWTIIGNQAPQAVGILSDVVLYEDQVLEDAIDLAGAFHDADGDPLTYTLDRMALHLDVDIDGTTGSVSLTPDPDWFGEEELVFVASDGELRVLQTVMVVVLAVNDPPTFLTLNGEPIGDGVTTFTILQGGKLEMVVGFQDPENHECFMEANTTMATVDTGSGAVIFEPDPEAVGDFYFRIELWDTGTAEEKASLDIKVVVENVNDPMDTPLILSPANGTTFLEDEPFNLSAQCFDPDIALGQVLTFSWSSNVSGLLGDGERLEIRLLEAGWHTITVTVSDPDYQASATIEVFIEEQVEPPPPPNNNGDPSLIDSSLLLILVLVLVVLGSAGIGMFGQQWTFIHPSMEPQCLTNRVRRRPSLRRKRPRDRRTRVPHQTMNGQKHYPRNR
jgi:hypothetical protein